MGVAAGWTPTEGAAILRRAGGTLLDDAPDLPEPRSRDDEEASAETALARIVRGWMEVLGPVRAADVAARLCLDEGVVEVALLRIESEGNVLRGQFTGHARARSMTPALPQVEAKGELKHWPGDQVRELEWCDRRLLARIHRRTLHQLRSEVEPVSPSVFYRFLLRWQHVEENTKLHGHQGLQAVLHQLQGFEAGASSWEPQILALRMRDATPEMLDLLCFSGEIGWARVSPVASLGHGPGRRLIPTRSSPITFLRREDAHWLLRAAGWRSDQVEDRLSANARRVAGVLEARGACFFNDLARFLQSGEVLMKSQIEEALWELASAGVVTADGFDNLRALFDPKRRGAQGRGRSARPRHSAGRWSLVSELMNPLTGEEDETPDGNLIEMPPEQARAQLAELCAKQLLRRYGVLCKTLMARESCALSWYEILVACRRLEARGEIRGGRFVSGLPGEQYALPHVVEALRATRKLNPLAAPVRLSAADPLNLAGILLPGERIPAHAEAGLVLHPATHGAGVVVEQTAAVLA
jgi:ATP-dependent Lhr-like helicase